MNLLLIVELFNVLPVLFYAETNRMIKAGCLLELKKVQLEKVERPTVELPKAVMVYSIWDYLTGKLKQQWSQVVETSAARGQRV